METWLHYDTERSHYFSRVALVLLHKVFTSRVLRAISGATVDSLFVNYQGVMIGDGEVWFDFAKGKAKIKAIN